jgi:hypothetical protein
LRALQNDRTQARSAASGSEFVVTALITMSTQGERPPPKAVASSSTSVYAPVSGYKTKLDVGEVRWAKCVVIASMASSEMREIWIPFIFEQAHVPASSSSCSISAMFHIRGTASSTILQALLMTFRHCRDHWRVRHYCRCVPFPAERF